MPRRGRKAETVVLIHGMYLGGWAMAWLARRLGAQGWRPCRFSYPTVRRPLAASVEPLQHLLGQLDTPVLHLVAHSLGGLLVRHLFDRFPDQRPGRIVTLGTPHQPSHVAVALAARPWSRWILGRSGPEDLLGAAPPWGGSHELGVIAGTLGAGIGRIVPHLPVPNDGTVALGETQLSRAADWISLPVTHTGLLLSPQVAEQVGAFLATGRFQRG